MELVNPDPRHLRGQLIRDRGGDYKWTHSFFLDGRTQTTREDKRTGSLEVTVSHDTTDIENALLDALGAPKASKKPPLQALLFDRR